MTTNTEKQSKVDTERSNICSSLTADPEDGEVSLVVKLKKLRLVNGSDTELSLDGRNERRSLEQSSSEGLNCGRELLDICETVMKAQYGDVFLSSSLLRFDKTSGTVDANDETACDLGVQCSRVTGLLDPQDPPDPCYDFV